MGIFSEFKRGVSDGWVLYWSPVTGLVRKAAGIIGLPESGQQAHVSQ
jgi:hypothetical protein